MKTYRITLQETEDVFAMFELRAVDPDDAEEQAEAMHPGCEIYRIAEVA